MKCEKYRKLMMGYLDNELSEKEVQLLREHLMICDECRSELHRFQTVKGLADTLNILTPEDKFWDGYWAGIYNRMERGLGWLFMSVGILFLFSGVLLGLFRDVIFNPGEPVWLRLGLPVMLLGLAALLTSVVRERFRAYKIERYRDVRR